MKLDYVSARGDSLPLVGNPRFDITNIDGMTLATSSLSSVVIDGVDGDDINSVNAQPRTIIIDLRIKDGVNVEDAKRKILEIVKIKQLGSLVWEQNNRTLKISGIVELVDMPRFGAGVTMQISLHCSQPFWENIDYIISQISEAVNLHYFTDMPDDMLYFPEDGIALGEFDTTRTKAFYNAGDVAIGLEIEIVAFDTVTNPIIYDSFGNFFGCGYGSGNKQIVMQAGDVIRINTRKNEKSITFNGTPIFGKVKPQSTWLQLQTGDNEYTINSDDESISNMTFSLKYKPRYV